MASSVISEHFDGYSTTVSRCMEAAGAADLLAEGRPVMLEPNLINNWTGRRAGELSR